MKNIVFVFLFFIPSLTRSQVITTIAGTGTAGFAGDGGAATAAKLWSPYGLHADRHGNIFIADEQNHRVRKIDITGNISTVAGNGSGLFSGDGGPATDAGVNSIQSIVTDTSGNLYILCNGGNTLPNVLRKVTVSGMISTIAGRPASFGYAGDGGPATAALLYAPFAIAADKAGNLYIADQSNNRIRKITPAGIISSIAGNGGYSFSGDGGPATSAGINGPGGVDVDDNGNIYLTDYGNKRVRKVNASGIITTIAGTGLSGYSGDGGPATAAQISASIHVAADKAGNVYIADAGNYVIRKINAFGIMSTVAGTGTCGFSGDGGPATAAQICNAFGIEIDNSGDLLISENYNHRVRKVISGNHAPVFVAGSSVSFSMCMGSTRSLDTMLKVSDADTGQMVSWTLITGPSHGAAAVSYTGITNELTLMPAGLSYTPAAGYSGPDSFKVMVSDGYASDTIEMHVTVINCSVGLEQIENFADDIRIAPNPATSILNIAASNKITSVAIINTLGRVLYDADFDGQHVGINIENLPRGVYMVRVNNTVVKRFIKY